MRMGNLPSHECLTHDVIIHGTRVGSWHTWTDWLFQTAEENSTVSRCCLWFLWHCKLSHMLHGAGTYLQNWVIWKGQVLDIPIYGASGCDKLWKLWGVPEIGVPLNHQFGSIWVISMGFSIINHPFGGTPFVEPPHMLILRIMAPNPRYSPG